MPVLYSDFITTLRRELRDFDVLGDDTFDGDGTSLLFPLAHRTIKSGSYVVKIGGVTKTETSDYTIDKDLGLITFIVAPVSGTANVEVTYRYNKMTDQEYIDSINDAIDRWRWKFWKDITDSTTFKSVANQFDYDMSSLTGILYIIQAWQQPTSITIDQWVAIQGITNWRYYPAQQKLTMNPPLSTVLSLKFRYLKALTKGTLTSSTLDINVEWYLPFKLYVKGVFFDRLVPEKIFETGAVTTIPTFTPAQLAYQMSQSYITDADKIANRIAPRLPNMPINNQMDGVVL